MLSSKKISLLLCLMPLAIMAKATTGKTDPAPLQGYVTDAVTKKPVKGVVVSVTLPGTSEFKEVITDAEGFFHFPQMPAAQVNLQFDKKGYQPIKRSGVSVKDKLVVKVNIEFQREDMETGADDSEYHMLQMLQSN